MRTNFDTPPPQDADNSPETFEIEDKNGEKYFVRYFKQGEITGGGSVDLTQEIPQIRQIAELAFPHWNRGRAERFADSFSRLPSFTLTYSPEGKVIGFNVFEIGQLQDSAEPVKVIYTDYAAVHPDYEGKELSQRSRSPVLDKEKPDIIAGSTGNPAIYSINSKLARERGMVFYPDSETVPTAVHELGKKISDQFSSPGSSADLDQRLVKTRRFTSSRGKGTFPLFDEELKLQPNQQVLYMAVTPGLNRLLLARPVRP